MAIEIVLLVTTVKSFANLVASKLLYCLINGTFNAHYFAKRGDSMVTLFLVLGILAFLKVLGLLWIVSFGFWSVVALATIATSIFCLVKMWDYISPAVSSFLQTKQFITAKTAYHIITGSLFLITYFTAIFSLSAIVLIAPLIFIIPYFGLSESLYFLPAIFSILLALRYTKMKISKEILPYLNSSLNESVAAKEQPAESLN